MLLPINFVDLDKKSLQGSLNNFVKTELSNYYDLKSEKEVEHARNVAVNQISSENCTEEACVKVMGELLDIEYTFSLEIIDTGEGWDLSVVRQDMDSVTSRRNELCNDCSLSKARKSLAVILTALRPGEMLIQRGKASLRLESTPRTQVFLDGSPQGKTPLDLSVDARVPLEIFMVAEGYNDFSEEFTLKPGEKKIKHAKLTRKRGNIRITSNPPKASIYVDGVLEMDAQDKTLLTPADLRLVYGQHELNLKLEKYEDATETLKINKKNLGTKDITLKPLPGRLIVRVPSEHKEASIMRDGDLLGRMNGEIAKNFEVPTNIRLTLQAEDGNFISKSETIFIEPDGSGRVEFEEFTETEKTSMWSGKGSSLAIFYSNPYATLKGTSNVKLNYNLWGLGFQWSRVRFESYTGSGYIEIDGDSTNSNSVEGFYFSDGSNIHLVESTNASIRRIMYAPKLPIVGRGSYGEWIWGVGFEWVTLTLTTKYDGNRTINMTHPMIDGGYQYTSKNSKQYFLLKYGISFVNTYENLAFSDGLILGYGYVF